MVLKTITPENTYPIGIKTVNPHYRYLNGINKR